MRWPWQPRHDEHVHNGEVAKDARRESEAKLASARRQQPEVDALSRALLRRRDEFARLVEEALRGIR